MEPVEPSLTDPIAGIAALKDPVRRALYLHVSEQGGNVSRDQAARALGIGRALAAFHLDRLVDEGLLQVSYQRLSGRRGPGAGRPSKLYRRSDRQIAVSLPPRSYELAARLFARSLAARPSPETLAALSEAARDFGEGLGEEARAAAGPDATRGERLEAVQGALAPHGFEPQRRADGSIVLRNCPFHSLAEEHRDLVCGMNLCLMQGVLGGLEAAGVEAVLNPRPGFCCVELRPT